MTVDEFFCSASQPRQPPNGSPGKSARPAGGNRCRTTSFVIATVSTARHLRAAFARWAFATDRQRRDRHGRTAMPNDRSARFDASALTVVLGELHLRDVLRTYAEYYNVSRTHLSLVKDAPVPRAVQ